MSFVVIAVLIVLTALAVGYVGLLLEEHAEWREWHVPRGKEFISYPLEYGEHDGLLLTDVEYATCKDLLEVRYTVENRNKGQAPVRNDLILAFQNGIGLRTVSPTTWTVMLEGAHARMTQSFRLVFCQVGVGRFGVSFSPCERRVSGRFGVGRSCWLLVIALVIA